MSDCAWYSERFNTALGTQVVRNAAKYQTAKPGHIPLASKMRSYLVPLMSQVKKKNKHNNSAWSSQKHNLFPSKKATS